MWATACTSTHTLDGQHRRRIDDRRPQQLLGQIVVRALERRAVERPRRLIEQHAPSQRVAVGAQSRRRQSDERVARLHPLARDQAIALGHADGEADEVELARFHRAGMLGHLAADERAARLLAALHHAAHELLDVRWIELADRDVVEEEQRLGALAHEVVDAHRDEVDPDRVEASRLPAR